MEYKKKENVVLLNECVRETMGKQMVYMGTVKIDRETKMIEE